MSKDPWSAMKRQVRDERMRQVKAIFNTPITLKHILIALAVIALIWIAASSGPNQPPTCADRYCN